VIRTPLLFLLVSLLLAGCSTAPRVTQSDIAWIEHQRHNAALTHWELRGRFALQDEDRAESASLRWRQSQGQSIVDLQGPVGMGATRIESDGVRVRVDDGTTAHYLDEAEYAGDMADWALPLTDLVWWVRGIPSPYSPVSQQVVDKGLLQKLVQSGWDIRFAEYQQAGDRVLPRRIELQRQATRAKLLIRQWNLQDPQTL